MNPQNEPTLWAAIGLAVVGILGKMIERFAPQFLTEQERLKQDIEADLWKRVKAELDDQDTKIREVREAQEAAEQRATQAEAERDEARRGHARALLRAETAEAERDDLRGEVNQLKARVQEQDTKIERLEKHVKQLEVKNEHAARDAAARKEAAPDA